MDQAFSEDGQSQQRSELQKNKEVCESELNRHQSRLDRLIDLYADGKYDRVTLDQKMEDLALSTHTKFLVVEDFSLSSFCSRDQMRIQLRLKVSGFVRLS